MVFTNASPKTHRKVRAINININKKRENWSFTSLCLNCAVSVLCVMPHMCCLTSAFVISIQNNMGSFFKVGFFLKMSLWTSFYLLFHDCLFHRFCSQCKQVLSWIEGFLKMFFGLHIYCSVKLLAKKFWNFPNLFR